MKDSKKAISAQNDLTLIAGQQAIITRAKKSIAGFRVREDMPMGAKVTLRGARMYEFMDRLTTVAMPRIRDFRGVSSKSFDGRGNYAFGIKEHIVFPEIDFDKIDEDWGLDVVITTTAETDAEVTWRKESGPSDLPPPLPWQKHPGARSGRRVCALSS